MEKISTSLEEFLKYIDFAKKEYDYCQRNVEVCNKATQDFLHELELGDYKDRRKVSTKLSNTRKARREFKDFVETSTSLIEWANSKNGSSTINDLKKILGEMRKQEKIKTFRTYNPRVIKDLDFLIKRETEKEKN